MEEIKSISSLHSEDGKLEWNILFPQGHVTLLKPTLTFKCSTCNMSLLALPGKNLWPYQTEETFCSSRIQLSSTALSNSPALFSVY